MSNPTRDLGEYNGRVYYVSQSQSSFIRGSPAVFLRDWPGADAPTVLTVPRPEVVMPLNRERVSHSSAEMVPAPMWMYKELLDRVATLTDRIRELESKR